MESSMHWISSSERVVPVPKDRERGSLVLETAICLPLVLFICWLLFAAICSVQTDLMLRYAADQTAAELSMLIPGVEALATETDVPQIKEFLGSLGGSEMAELKRDGFDLASSVAFSQLINRRIDYWLQQAVNGNRAKLPAGQRRLWLALSDEKKTLELQLKYQVSTPFNASWHDLTSVVPLWTRYDLAELSQQAKEDADSQIWSADNFTRGRYFRQKIKANLPFNFPVICNFSGGIATAMRSIDLTAPSYQNQEQLYKELNAEIKQLANFSGASQADVTVQNIRSKRLVFIIPQNSPEPNTSNLLATLTRVAQDHGIELAVQRIGKSERYQKKPGDA